jgi:hypothetical protein
MGLFGNNFGNNNENDDQNDQRMVPRNAIMCLVAVYLMYLGFNILRGWYQGDPGMPPWVAVLFGILFIVIGAVYLFYLLRPFLTKKSGEESAELPENGESAATPEGEASAAALPESGEQITGMPEGGEKTAALPESGEQTAAMPEGGEQATALPQNNGGKDGIPGKAEPTGSDPHPEDEKVSSSD